MPSCGAFQSNTPKIYKKKKQHNSYEWSKFVEPAMKIYLNRMHRTIKMSPLEAKKEKNQSALRTTLHIGGDMKKPI